MNRYLFFIILILTFVFGHNVLRLVGYPQGDFSTSTFYRLYPLTYLATAVLGYYLMIGRLRVSDIIYRMTPEFVLLSACFLVIFYLKYTNNLDAISFLLNTLYLPGVISILFKSTDREILYQGKNLVYGVFFLNALMAVIEKVRGIALLGLESHHFMFFRPSALFGHPLNNALIMAVLTIVLYYGSRDRRLKVAVLLTGMIAIFCFGARGGMIGVFVGILVNTLCHVFGIGKEGEERFVMMKEGLLTLIGFGVIFFIVLNFTQLGSRIARLSFSGSSAAVRLKAVDVLHGLSVQNLLWGHSLVRLEYLSYRSGVPIIENFWIIWMLRFGMIVTFLFVLSLFYFLYQNMRDLTKDVKYSILATFFCVASTNNSLASSTLVVSMLVASVCIIYYGKEYAIQESAFSSKHSLLKK